jgi:carbamoyl-phosphate synthase/aspartate carbamoyltransferase/dihydroorotase
MLRLPGLIDPHVHLRGPGAAHREDFDSGTAAALAGGFTAVLCKPDTDPPLTDGPSLAQAQSEARDRARCDYGLYLAAGADNFTELLSLASLSSGLEIIMSPSYGSQELGDLAAVHTHIAGWPANRPLAVHAQGMSLPAAMLIAHLHDRPIHICHVSREAEIVLIRAAKERGMKVTCEVTPHHLFFTGSDLPGTVEPALADAADLESLWANLDVIDCFATDHTPHALEEKAGANSPPGFAGLETALGLYLRALHEGRLSQDDLLARTHTNPARIFDLPKQTDTWIEVDENVEWEVRADQFFSRGRWSPYEGMALRGVVRKVRLHGRVAFEDGTMLASPGDGRSLAPASQPIFR